uniref:NADH dehydrogenase subunit 6 n=1 Tax=Stenocephus fraxini TaxID=2963023 RepID=A0A9E8Z0Z4_9HYME|nr:NADH dehydrogenase subunit 6 [Stenocephus fraxini]WAK85078.1 NADH dehydrogenase subunit 6 [Stenocephus fraxini]
MQVMSMINLLSSYFIPSTNLCYKLLISYFMIMTVMIPLIIMSIHPVTLMLLLILFSLLVSMKIKFIYSNFWFSYMLFLAMIGGVLIMFLYLTSTASNEKIKINLSYLILILFTMFCMLIMFMSITLYYDLYSMSLTMNNNINMNQNFFLTTNNWSNMMSYKSLNMFNDTYKMSLMIMMYLLFTLYTLMKLCMKMYGPLRQFM